MKYIIELFLGKSISIQVVNCSTGVSSEISLLMSPPPPTEKWLYIWRFVKDLETLVKWMSKL